MLNGQLYVQKKISEVNLSAFVYRLFSRVDRNLHETVCKQMHINQLLLSLCIPTAHFRCVNKTHKNLTLKVLNLEMEGMDL